MREEVKPIFSFWSMMFECLNLLLYQVHYSWPFRMTTMKIIYRRICLSGSWNTHKFSSYTGIIQPDRYYSGIIQIKIHCDSTCYKWLGCSPKANKSVFWSELPGTRWYTANSFFIMYSESIGTSLLKTRVIQTYPKLHGKHRWPIYDNGTSNALKSPLTTELTTLGHIFWISGQNYIGIHL